MSADFLGDLGQVVWVAAEEIDGPDEHMSCGVGTGSQEETGVDVQLFVHDPRLFETGELGLLVIDLIVGNPDDVREKVQLATRLASLDACPGLLIEPLVVVDPGGDLFLVKSIASKLVK